MVKNLEIAILLKMKKKINNKHIGKVTVLTATMMEKDLIDC